MPKATPLRLRAWWPLALLPLLFAGNALVSASGRAIATDSDGATDLAQRGFELLTGQPMSATLFTVEDLDRLWTVWEPEERARAEAATDAERRFLTFERYGFVERDFDSTGLPLGYTVDERGNLYPNCLSCHGGKVAGRAIPGLANTHQDLTALAEDLAALRAVDQGRDPEAARRSATLGYPLNFYKGLTNATQFSLILAAMRDEHLDLVFPPKLPATLTHNDIDAPAWWQYKKKERIYIDAMAPKTPRGLMQFTMAPGVTGERIRSWEEDFVAIEAYISSLEAPSWPWEVDVELAERGRSVFEQSCARCHGTYGAEESYPGRVVPIEEIGTDPVRLEAVPRESKERYNRMWFSNYGEHPVELDVVGYQAPPLDGVWATAPYFHNGSVPTLWHVLHPEERPTVWRRTENGYDRERIGLEVVEREAVPDGLNPRERRTWYDTAVTSHDAGGHLYPAPLEPDEKRALLEYLKTL